MSAVAASPSIAVPESTTIISKVFGSSPKTRILNYFLDFPANDFVKKEITEALGMSKQTLYKYFDDLEQLGIIKINRTIGKAKLYMIDLDSPIVKMIKNFEEEMSMEIAQRELAEEPIPAKQL